MAVAVAEPVVDAITVRGGRRLSYAEYGDRTGSPVLFFHGFPGSKWQARLLAEPAADLGVRLVSVDRPGIGSSGYQMRRWIRDWPRDVAALVGVLGLEEVAVLGYGAGAPYALAVAHDVDNRLTATGVLNGVAPPSVIREKVRPGIRLLFDVRRYLPLGAVPGVLWMAHKLTRTPDEYVRASTARGADRTVGGRPLVHDVQRASYLSTFQQGLHGPLREATLLQRGWGFRLEGVTRHVKLWHGTDDGVVPLSRAETVAGRLPDATATFFAGEGHRSVLVDRGRDVLGALVE